MLVRNHLARAVAVALLLWSVSAAQMPPEFPGAGADDFSYGPLGAEGQPLTKAEAKDLGLERKATGLRVTRVFEEGSGHEAGLLAGDIIVATAAGPLMRSTDPTEGPIVQLTMALEAAEATRKGKLVMLVKRAGKDEKLTVMLDKLGKHSRTCPAKCKKCQFLYVQSLQALADMQLGDGSMPMSIGGSGGGVVVASLTGLAFLSSGSTPRKGLFKDNIEKAKKFVVRSVGSASPFSREATGGANWNQENWELSYAPWFLAEYYRHNPSANLKKKLQEIADRLIANMEASGGWAHGPGGPNALNYLELEIMSNFALTALGCMRSVGIEVDQAALDRARDYVIKCTTGDGGVAYSDRPGQVGHGEAGRTAGAYLGFARCNYQDHPMFVKMGNFFIRKDKLGEMPNGHVSPVMHFLAGGLAAWESGKFQIYWDKFRTTWRSFRQPDGVFTALPTAESQQLHSNSDRGCGPGWITASYTLIMGIALDNLPVLLPGKKRGKPVEPVVPEPEEAVTTEDGGGPPQGEPGAPGSGTGAPADGQGDQPEQPPASDGESTPSGEHEDPAGEHEDPAGEHEDPAGEHEDPAGDGDGPDEGGVAAIDVELAAT